MAEVNQAMAWTFVREVPVPDDIKSILIEGEQAMLAYATVRDTAVVTNKRIIIADKQGLTGKKVEIFSIPFKSIVMYSSENAGNILDFNTEIEIWTYIGSMKLKLKKGVDIRKLDKLIAQGVL